MIVDNKKILTVLTMGTDKKVYLSYYFSVTIDKNGKPIK